MASEGLEARLAALEARVGELAERLRTVEQDAAAARVLAGGAQRGVTEMGTQIRDFRQAVMSALADAGERVSGQFDQVYNEFAEIRGKLAAVGSAQARIVALLTTRVERGGNGRSR
ncbi:permease [Nocardia sp. CY41]|uniref:permease n=1 Tax=Nocardia sp. CY41 TaxID=2608686 RepID=UPI00135A6FAB|nr:permease [Nocardia sp. CY41]